MNTDESERDELAAPAGDAEVRRHSRKVRAVLAAGLVLGLGGVATLAVYSSSTFGQAVFTSGKFNTQGKFRSSDWQDFDKGASGVGDFAFQVQPLQMLPGTTVYAPVSIRVDPTKNGFDAAVSLSGATSTTPGSSIFTALRLTVNTVSVANCNATGFTTGAVIPGYPANAPLSQPSTQSVTVPKGNANGVDFCFALTLPSSFTEQNVNSGLMEWTFSATSITP